MRFEKLTGVHFNNPALPIIKPYETRLVEEIPEIRLWARSSPYRLKQDEAGYVSWANEVTGAGLTNADLTKQPTLTESLLNGKPGLTWPDSGTKVLNWGGTTDVSATAKTTRVAVARLRAAAGASTTPFLFASSQVPTPTQTYRNALYYRNSTGVIEYAIGSDVLNAGAIPLDTFIVIFAAFDRVAQASKFAIGANAATVRNIPAGTVDYSLLSDDLIVGAQTTGGSNMWNGDIAEFLYVEADLLASSNAAKRTLLLEYFSAKFGI